MLNIQKNISLKNYTTFKTGGPADFFCIIEKREDLVQCFEWIKQEKLDFFCLGNGSNLLINDAGFRGVVIKIDHRSTVWNGDESTSGAGVLLAALVSEAKNRSLGGMEWAFGIPASLGGAARNNAGAFGYSMSDCVASVEVFDTGTGQFLNLKKEDCNYSYRKSVFQKNPSWLIWQIKIGWSENDPEKINENIQKYLAQRKNNQPLDKHSAGSFFRNLSLTNLEENKKQELINGFVKKRVAEADKEKDREQLKKEIFEKTNQSNVLPAAYLIEETGLKGRAIGGAQVSEKHANFIINTGDARTEDVIILASMIKQKVRLKFGVQLFEEVEYVGF